MAGSPSKYYPDKYFVEERDIEGNYYYAVNPTLWFVFLVITFPLRCLPLFKRYKFMYQVGKVLVFRSDKEVQSLNEVDT